MLGSAATIEMLAQALRDYRVETVVLDPVSWRARTGPKTSNRGLFFMS